MTGAENVSDRRDGRVPAAAQGADGPQGEAGKITVGDPDQVMSLPDLARELGKLRRRAARPGQFQLSIRDIAARTGRAPSTLDPYLRGVRLCPADTYEDLLRALGVRNAQLRPWLAAWERIADAGPSTPSATTRERPSAADRSQHAAVAAIRRPRVLNRTEEYGYRLTAESAGPVRIGVVTGDIRRVRCADIWVNPENTSMKMPRIEEHSVSAIIRFEGAARDGSGHIIDDLIADDLVRKAPEPVVPGTAVTTTAGALSASNGLHHVIHVAVVHGEPGEGFRQVRDVGRCVTEALSEMERLRAGGSSASRILFPLLGTGVGGAEPEPTMVAMLGATLDFFLSGRGAGISTVYFLAYTDLELETCREILDGSPELEPHQ